MGDGMLIAHGTVEAKVNFPVTKEAMVGWPREWKRTGFLHYDPKGLGTQTFSIASGTAGMTRHSDKRAGTRAAVSSGSVRFEAECRKPCLKACAKIKRLGGVMLERVEKLARNREEWSQMGVGTVGCADDHVSAVRRLQLKVMEPFPSLAGLRSRARAVVFALRSEPQRRSFADLPVRPVAVACRCSLGASTSPTD